ncbi:RICIN domain-containing protein [Kitasatospora sp. NPDC018619]|uniref:RICIN domain-containing protein n=1 Tax=unclassified Kitasatospora TaxID=2633591 RepID=UPI00378F422D
MLRLAGKSTRTGAVLATTALAATAFLGVAGQASAVTGESHGNGSTRLAVTADGGAAAGVAALTAAGQHFQNVNSGKCLVVRGTAESSAVQSTCGDWADQLWKAYPSAAGSTFQLQDVNSGKCLVVRGTAENAGAVQSTCGDWADQFWNIYYKSTSDQYQFQNVNSGKCLAVRGTAENAGAVQSTCGDWADQWWKIY